MNVELFEQKLASVSGQDSCPGLVLEKVQQWILDSELVQRIRINPYEVADATGAPIEEIIAVALNGVIAGAFDLHWLAHCPHCNMVTKDAKEIHELTSSSQCPMCEVEFLADFLTRVEVTFSLNNAIEDTKLPPFCFPPPVLKPKVGIAALPGQIVKGDGEIREPGIYRFFCPVTLSKGLMCVEGEPAEAVQEVDLIQLASFNYDKTVISCKPGKLTVKLENGCSQLAGVYIIDDNLPDEIPLEKLPRRLTGLSVLHHPEYKRLFGKQVLSAREQIRVSSAVLMFTDIAGSTRLYETIGSAQAYNAVRDHFDILFDCIWANGGLVVKTIGDAVMASFVDADAALCSMFQILKAFSGFENLTDSTSGIRIKIGMHAGPVLLVNLNGVIDYFGATVNLAANIQALAEANEAVLTSELVANSACKALQIASTEGRLQHERISLKGIGQVRDVCRLTASSGLQDGE